KKRESARTTVQALTTRSIRYAGRKGALCCYKQPVVRRTAFRRGHLPRLKAVRRTTGRLIRHEARRTIATVDMASRDFVLTSLGGRHDRDPASLRFDIALSKIVLRAPSPVKSKRDLRLSFIHFVQESVLTGVRPPEGAFTSRGFLRTRAEPSSG